MATTVPVRPTAAVLRRLGIAKPVSSAHGLRWTDMLAFLLAHNVQSVYSGWFGSQAGNSKFSVAWSPSPLCKVLYVAIELLEASASPSLSTFAVSIAGGTWLEGRLDGTQALSSPRTGRRARQVWDAYFDVSGATAGAIQDIACQWTNSALGVGVARLHVFEVPLADVDPATSPATEPGLLAGAWPNPPNLLSDSAPGVTALGYGFPRIYAGLDLARAQWRTHRQLVTPENGTESLSTTSAAFAQFTWPMIAGGYDPQFRLQASRLYTTADPEVATLKIRYSTASALDTADFRAVINGVNNDFGAGALPGSTTWVSKTLAVNVPTSTAGQIVPVTFAGKTSGTFRVSQIALIRSYS